MRGDCLPLALFLLLCFAIVVVDYCLGPVAEYLNAYEILRRSFAPGWPARSARMLWREECLGALLWPAAWSLWLLEAALITALLRACHASSRPFWRRLASQRVVDLSGRATCLTSLF